MGRGWWWSPHILRNTQCVYSAFISLVKPTERYDLQGEEGLESLAPLTAQTAGAIEPIFVQRRDRTGLAVAIFEFPS